jgi:hypothetical protein
LGATLSPLTFSPFSLFPENVKTGMVDLSLLSKSFPPQRQFVGAPVSSA